MIGLRATALRTARRPFSGIHPRNVRFQTNSSSSSSSPSASNGSGAILGGVAGGSLVFLVGYSWYHFSGAKTVVTSASQTKAYFDKALQRTKQATPPPSEAIQWLRETALHYAAVIPGAKGYVDSAFNDLDAVHEKHRDEVDGIVKEAYGELKELGDQGFSVTSVTKAWEILQKHLGKIGHLAQDAGEDILNNHPQLKEQFGGEVDRLKQMADNYGPEAKKQVDETWGKIQDAMKGGFSFNTAEKVKGIVQETTQKVQKIGDEAWQKGMEQAKPYLDKSPQLKELVESNKSKLMQGNAMELVQKIKDAASSGKSEDLEKYVKDTAKKSGMSGSGGLEQYFKMIPSGGSIWSNLSQLEEAAERHGKEAEKLFKEAMEEVQQVLSKKADEGKKLAEKAKKDASK